MIEGIPFAVADLSLGGLLALILVTFVVALLKGWIVPKGQNDDTQRSRNYWRDSSLNKDKTIWALTQAVLESTAGNETVVKVMSTLQDKIEETEEDSK